MDKYYTINEIAMFTGLTTRTIRTYLKMNILSGEKIDGTWQFTEEDVTAFLKNPYVKTSVEAKQNAIVYDALARTDNKENESCVILNLNISDEESQQIIQFFNRKLNSGIQGNMRFHYAKSGSHVRIILSGTEDIIIDILKEAYHA